MGWSQSHHLGADSLFRLQEWQSTRSWGSAPWRSRLRRLGRKDTRRKLKMLFHTSESCMEPQPQPQVLWGRVTATVLCGTVKFPFLFLRYFFLGMSKLLHPPPCHDWAQYLSNSSCTLSLVIYKNGLRIFQSRNNPSRKNKRTHSLIVTCQ